MLYKLCNILTISILREEKQKFAVCQKYSKKKKNLQS